MACARLSINSRIISEKPAQNLLRQMLPSQWSDVFWIAPKRYRIFYLLSRERFGDRNSRLIVDNYPITFLAHSGRPRATPIEIISFIFNCKPACHAQWNQHIVLVASSG